MTGSSLREHAAGFASLALENITREFPNAPQHVVADASDRALPRELHPSFYGSYDWHSAVHMHWLLVRLRHRRAKDVDAAAIDDALSAHLSADALDAEAAYLRQHASFERPYGWAWLLALAAECKVASRVAAAQQWSAALGSCVDAVESLVLDWLPRAGYPVRHGTHANTAFSLGLLLDAAQVLGRDELATRLFDASRKWFADDRDLPAQWEPSGEDFLSPALCQADLVRRTVDGRQLGWWLDGALPGLMSGAPVTLLAPVSVADGRDGRIGHLHGLNLSRAAALRSIAAALPADDRRVGLLQVSAEAHLAAALPSLGQGGYLGDHWLASFATLALDGWPGTVASR
jgi:Protein of unknown function (DUF2891)